MRPILVCAMGLSSHPVAAKGNPSKLATNFSQDKQGASKKRLSTN